MKKESTDNRYLRPWPQLAVLAEQPGPVYILLTQQQLTQACASGELMLSGKDLALTRLDMALIGLMQEFGEDFFLDDFFVSRTRAAVEILLAARVFLEQKLPGREEQEQRVQLLAMEAEAALSQWESLLKPVDGQTLLYAAEEKAELI